MEFTQQASSPSFGPFSEPVKAINSRPDFDKFLKSEAFQQILAFVRSCAESAVGVSCLQDDPSAAPVIGQFITFMDRLYEMVGEVPPIQQPMRFGNKAFREWHKKLGPEAQTFLQSALPADDRAGAWVELHPYFMDMFGNPTRIDYGTGHELNFAIVFLLFQQLQLIRPSDLKFVTTKAFPAYIRTMRRLQLDYLLEPAGSHGVWGLDDYHCLIFLWGSAQLSTNQDISPSAIHDLAVLQEHSKEFMYLEGIHFIRTIKKGAPFAETSPMLNDVSHIADWGRICTGLMRLFQGEVLTKFPVIQHLLFGSLLKATWMISDAPSAA